MGSTLSPIDPWLDHGAVGDCFIGTRMVEHDVARKIGAIFDFRDKQIDHNQKTGQALERIEAKVEVLQIETSNLRRIK